METDPKGVHEERPSPGSSARYTLDPRGLQREEFTSGVPTHRQVIPYGEVWDTYTTQEFPRVQVALLAGLSLLWVASAFLMELAPALSLINAFLLGFAWALVIWKSRVVTLKLFDYEGYELAVLHGLPGPAFDAFTAELGSRIAAHRYPLQGVFEAMDLGRCEIECLVGSWTGVFLYDRVVFERTSPFRRRSRVYHALTLLEAPIRLAWRVPRVLLAAVVLSAAVGLALASEAWRGDIPDLWPWVWGCGAAALLLLAASVGLAGVAVEVSAGTHPIRTAYMPWWRRGARREALAWFARLVQLADLLDGVRTDDYWDFHRAKLKVLREAGFIEDWPYRSALARLNSQEREELGE